MNKCRGNFDMESKREVTEKKTTRKPNVCITFLPLVISKGFIAIINLFEIRPFPGKYG